jgi:hypothetical protein
LKSNTGLQLWESEVMMWILKDFGREDIKAAAKDTLKLS